MTPDFSFYLVIMKRILPLLFILSFSGVIAQEACERLENAEIAMEGTYETILMDYAENGVFIDSFRKAQTAWKQYRDASLDARFPGAKSYYGSSYATCRCEVLADLTEKRNNELKLWLEGLEEGEICAGSVKFKEE